MEFNPRITQILFLLLNADHPITVNEFAMQLQISRRTIFRELQIAGASLEKLGLKLSTKSNKGIVLVGAEADKQILLEQLKHSDYFDPRNKEERQKKLILQILKQEETTKLCYYASLLQVSEATISNDMEAVAPWFAENNLELRRKSGYGVGIEGTELNYRKAMIHYFCRNADIQVLQSFKHKKDFDKNNGISELVQKDILIMVMKVLDEMGDRRVLLLTEISYAELVLYLSIMVSRIRKGKHVIVDGEYLHHMMNTPDYDFARKVALLLEDAAQIVVGEAEIAGVSIYVRATKSQSPENGDVYRQREEDSLVWKMAVEMIEYYDQDMAGELKRDEDFVESLAAHLKPTLIRLRHKIAVHNPFLERVKKEYQDIYDKTEAASRILEGQYQIQITADEIGLLALHFGAATLRLSSRMKAKRKIQVGVVCTSGIGISRLLSSKLKCVFENQIHPVALAETEVYGDKMQNIQFLVSTFDLIGVSVPVISVNPLLTDEDIRRIGERLELSANMAVIEESSRKERDLLLEVGYLEAINRDINSIITYFNVFYADSRMEFSDMVSLTARLFGDDEVLTGQIRGSLLQREALSSQIIPEYRIALLHAKVEGISLSKFIVILPEGDSCFSDPYFKGAEVVIGIIIPKADVQYDLPIADISMGVFENQEFLDCLKSGQKSEIDRYIQYYMKQYLGNFLKKLYEENC